MVSTALRTNMTIDIWLAFVGLALTFLITPGISHLLMLSNSLAYGVKRSLATAAGDLTANILQMLAAGLGIATLITKAPAVFFIIKWLGVAYLLYLGLKLIFGNARPTVRKAVNVRQLYMQGFVTSGSNPKAIVFFAALFPQFISPSNPLAPQLLALILTYLFLDGCFLIAYGFGAEILSKRVKNTSWLHPISGIFIIIAAMMLAWKSVDRA